MWGWNPEKFTGLNKQTNELDGDKIVYSFKNMIGVC